MKFSTFAVSLTGLIGPTLAAPNQGEVQSYTVDAVAKIISPASGLETRANVQTQAGTIYRDGNGVCRTIFVLQVTERLLQAFDNSGVNLAQAVLSEILRYGRENNFSAIVRRNLWDAEFDAAAKILSGQTFMSLAITARGSIDGITGVTLLLQDWLEQSGNMYFGVKEVANALAHNKRSGADSGLEERKAPPQFCNGGWSGFYNALVVKDPSPVSVKANC